MRLKYKMIHISMILNDTYINDFKKVPLLLSGLFYVAFNNFPALHYTQFRKRALCSLLSSQPYLIYSTAKQVD